MFPGKASRLGPAQVVAFFRLVVERLALPARHADEKIHALVVFAAMHHAGEFQIRLVKLQADLFACFADARG